MDPVVIVDPATVTVAPGGETTVTVSVRSQSPTDDRFRLDVLGDAAGWSHVEPEVLDVTPQGQAFATITFAPPAGASAAAAAGQMPFGIRVVSLVDPSASAVGEGDIVVSQPGNATITLEPEMSKGWRAGHHELAITNWGGADAHLSFEVTQVSKAFQVDIDPSQLDVPIGGHDSAKVVVKPRSTFVRGDRVHHRFQVIARDAGTTRTVLDGGYEQRPLIGRLAMAIGVLAIVGLVGFVAFGWLSGLGGGDDDDAGSGNGDGSSVDTSGAPATPAEFAAEAVASDLVHLSWGLVPEADSYSAFSVDPATAEDPEPTVLQSFDGIPTTQGGYDAVDLEPATRYCFQVAAVRGDASSDRAPAQCADTLAVATTGGPTQVTVELANPEQARVSWVDGSGGQAEHLVRQNGPVAAIVSAGTTQVAIDLDPGENCFRVQSRIEGATSPATDPQCVTGPTETTPPADLGVIAVVSNGVIPLSDPQAEQRANQRRDELRAAGHAADVLNTADYPRLQRESGDFLHVYIGGFGTADEALAYCQNAGLTCVTEEPGGRGG
jgi:hypothetical protein